MIICFALATIFLIVGVFLFNGKGGWLIAGYNTMTKEEKEQYNKKKLFRAVGIVCIVCCTMLCIMGYLGHRVDAGLLQESAMVIYALIFIAVILLAIIFAGIYIKKKPDYRHR